MDEVPKQNTGVVLGQRDTDYVAGTIPYEVRNEKSDWRPFLVKEEKQYSDNVDTMGCISFSANNSLEIQHKQQTGKEANFSDRFLAKMSDTQHFGNWQYKVADAIRMYGSVLEEEYPSPQNYTWDSYYSPIPADIMDKAKKYDTAYEWVDVDKASLQHHLKHAPLQVVITKTNPNHAVCLVALEGDTAYYFDSYPQYLKTINVSQIYNALKLVLTVKQMNPNIVIYKNGSEYHVAVKSTSQQGLAQLLVQSGCYDLIGSDGNPDFSKIDKIAHAV